MDYKRRIDNLEKIYKLTLDGYKNAYVQKERISTSENENLFEQANGRLNNVYRKFMQLKSEIEGSIKVNKNKIVKGNMQISAAEKRWNTAENSLSQEYNVNLASKPLKLDANKENNNAYLTNIFYVCGIATMVGFIVKQFNSNKLPITNSIPIARAVPY